MEKKVYTKVLTFAIFLFVFLAITPHFAHAATLYFSPSSGSHAVGTTLSVSIYASSANQAMNAASGAISFPRDKLEVTSLSKTGSIFSLWVQEPSFSNSAGTVNFEGIVLNPGFIGSNGRAITITFRTKAAGNAPLTFSSGSVLANDGKGTNILTGMGDANFAIGVVGPGAPEISSPTHPDPNEWYALEGAKFFWDSPSGITGTRLIVGRIQDAVPTATYIPAINSKEFDNLEDGIWYFSVRLRNDAGWGVVSNFRFQIDTVPPAPFLIAVLGGKETLNPRPTILFDTTDKLSGVDYYKVKLGEGDYFSLSSEIVKSNPYTLPYQTPGQRTIIVQAFDKAGNYTAASEEFTVLPPPGAVEKAGAEITKFLAILIPISALFILFLFMLWYGWHKFLLMRKQIRKEIREVESALHRAFDLLKEDVQEQIKMLEKTRGRRQLTEEEKKIVKQLKKDLDDAEKFIRKEVEDIEKEVK